jgi:hypothetical protein
MRHAMLAGSYQGSLGRYHQNTISAQGAGMRTAALHSALGRTGISGLGDLCQDGWMQFATGLISGAGSALTAYGNQTAQMPAELRQSNDPLRPIQREGQTDANYARQVAVWEQDVQRRNQLRDEWQAGNTRVDQGWAAVGTGATTAADSFRSGCAARQQNQANASNTAGFEQQFGRGATTSPPPPPAESKGIDTTTLIVIGAVALGAVVLLRK